MKSDRSLVSTKVKLGKFISLMREGKTATQAAIKAFKNSRFTVPLRKYGIIKQGPDGAMVLAGAGVAELSKFVNDINNYGGAKLIRDCTEPKEPKRAVTKKQVMKEIEQEVASQKSIKEDAPNYGVSINDVMAGINEMNGDIQRLKIAIFDMAQDITVILSKVAG
jgi:hypothetical protein